MALRAGKVEENLQKWLGSTGTNKLPYSDILKRDIRKQIVDCIHRFPTLDVNTDQHTDVGSQYEQGFREVTLLVLHGTIPMWYQGTKYNVPVQIYLPEMFPQKPPMMYVRPVQSMFIKPNHPTVKRDGFVASLYLQNWSLPPSALVDAVEDASIQFSSESPIFSQPKGTTGQPPPPPAHPGGITHHTNPLSKPPGQPSSYPAASMAASRPPVQPQASVHVGYSATGGQTATSSTSIDDAFRQRALDMLTQRIAKAKEEVDKVAGGEHEELLKQQGLLQQRNDDLKQELHRLQQERSHLEAAVKELSQATVGLDLWLEKNEPRLQQAMADQPSAEEIIQVADPYSKQALRCQAKDLAIEETLYTLQTLQEKHLLDNDLYYRKVRELYRQQFLVRALNRRIGEFQAAHTAHTRNQYQSSAGPELQLHGPEGSVELQQVDQWSHNTLHHYNPLQAKVS